MIKSHHPRDRADRLRLKRKYSFKHSRRQGGEATVYKGLSDGTNSVPEAEASDIGRIDETPSEENVGIRDATTASDPLEECVNKLPGSPASIQG